jgi:hypothetical protein
MFNLNRFAAKYNTIKTIYNCNKNKKLYQQINKKNQQMNYNKISKRKFASSAHMGGGGDGGGGGGNDYWKLAAMAVSVYVITNINKPPPPAPFKSMQFIPFT